MNTINWGIIGAGNISTRFSKVLAGESGMAVRAIYNRHIGRALALAENFPGCAVFDRVEDVLAVEGLDVIYIGLTNDMHLPVALQCLRAGKAVLCEKPMALNAGDARQMISLAREKNVLLMEAMWTRFLPVYGKVKEWIDSGRIGKVRMVDASFCYRWAFDAGHRLYRKDMGGGALYDIGVYAVEFITGLLGRPDAVESAAYFGPSGVDEQCVVNLLYSSGIIGTAISSIASAAPARAHIYGEKGSIVLPVDFFRAKEALLYAEDGSLAERFDDQFDDGFIYQIRHVGGLVRAGKTQSDIMPLSDTLDCAMIFDAVLAGKEYR